MLSGTSLRRLAPLLAPLLLACVLAVAVLRQKFRKPSANLERPEASTIEKHILAVQGFLRTRAGRAQQDLMMLDIGVFSGLKLERDFQRAAFWDRTCEIHSLAHGLEDDDEEVYTAAYNECTGVSDVVYYKIDPENFEKGGGRGPPGWKNDEKLVDLMRRHKKKSNEYATVVDYKGCGLFALDRGHQAPVASFNFDMDAAQATNTPTNLSPQSSYLNQGVWRYLEAEMRYKASLDDLDEDELEDAAPSEFEMLTGPLYELPDAFFTNKRGKKSWEDLLQDGGDLNTKQPWCENEDDDDGFRSDPLEGREEKVTCRIGRKEMDHASDDPNQLQLHYLQSAKKFPLRIPLGYYKLAVIEDDSHFGRHTCPYIMDQAGQCMLVSLELMLQLAHINLDHTKFARKGGTDIHSDDDYSAKVDPEFCIRKGGTLDKYKLCYTGSHDKKEITQDMMKDYWRIRDRAEK